MRMVQQKGEPMFCPHCGAKRLDTRGLCQICGREAPELLEGVFASPDEIVQEGGCSNCGVPLVGDEVFCGQCGEKVIAPVPGLPPPRPPALPNRTTLLVGVLCFAASLLAGGAAIWLAVGGR